MEALLIRKWGLKSLLEPSKLGTEKPKNSNPLSPSVRTVPVISRLNKLFWCLLQATGKT